MILSTPCMIEVKNASATHGQNGAKCCDVRVKWSRMRRSDTEISVLEPVSSENAMIKFTNNLNSKLVLQNVEIKNRTSTGTWTPCSKIMARCLRKRQQHPRPKLHLQKYADLWKYCETLYEEEILWAWWGSVGPFLTLTDEQKLFIQTAQALSRLMPSSTRSLNNNQKLRLWFPGWSVPK